MKTVELRTFAAKGVQAELTDAKDRVTKLEQMLGQLTNGGRPVKAKRMAKAVGKTKRRGTPMTPAQRKAVSANMRAYWARTRAEKETATKSTKPHWTQTPAGRKRMSQISTATSRQRLASMAANR
jgi:hypothetical protein